MIYPKSSIKGDVLFNLYFCWQIVGEIQIVYEGLCDLRHCWNTKSDKYLQQTPESNASSYILSLNLATLNSLHTSYDGCPIYIGPAGVWSS